MDNIKEQDSNVKDTETKVDDNQNTVGEDQQQEIDQQELDRIAGERTARAERSALKSYFKQQGLSEEEAQEAFDHYKAEKAAEKEAERNDLNALRSKVEQYENAETEAMKIANRRLIRAEAKVMAITLNVKPERIDHAIRLADLSNVDIDENGNVDNESLKEAMEKVTQEIPELLLKKDDEDNRTGFKLGGSGQKGTAVADQISKIFGNK